MISEIKQFAGTLTFSLHFPYAHSLKEKRMVLKSIKERIKSRFNVSACELDANDKWQAGHLGVAMISSDKHLIENTFEKIYHLIETTENCEICEHQVDHF